MWFVGATRCPAARQQSCVRRDGVQKTSLPVLEWVDTPHAVSLLEFLYAHQKPLLQGHQCSHRWLHQWQHYSDRPVNRVPAWVWEVVDVGADAGADVGADADADAGADGDVGAAEVEHAA